MSSRVLTQIERYEQATQQILEAGGNLELASERLGGDITPFQLKAMIAGERALHQSMIRFYRVDALVNLASTLETLRLNIISRMDEVPAEALMDSYSKLLERLLDFLDGRKSAGQQNIINNNTSIDMILEQLPERVRDLVLEVADHDQ